jgi:hypothetical protein
MACRRLGSNEAAKKFLGYKSEDSPPKKFLSIMFTPARDFLLETPWRIIIPNPNVNSHSP